MSEDNGVAPPAPLSKTVERQRRKKMQERRSRQLFIPKLCTVEEVKLDTVQLTDEGESSSDEDVVATTKSARRENSDDSDGSDESAVVQFESGDEEFEQKEAETPPHKDRRSPEKGRRDAQKGADAALSKSAQNGIFRRTLAGDSKSDLAASETKKVAFTFEDKDIQRATTRSSASPPKPAATSRLDTPRPAASNAAIAGVVAQDDSKSVASEDSVPMPPAFAARPFLASRIPRLSGAPSKSPAPGLKSSTPAKAALPTKLPTANTPTTKPLADDNKSVVSEDSIPPPPAQPRRRSPSAPGKQQSTSSALSKQQPVTSLLAQRPSVSRAQSERNPASAAASERPTNDDRGNNQRPSPPARAASVPSRIPAAPAKPASDEGADSSGSDNITPSRIPRPSPTSPSAAEDARRETARRVQTALQRRAGRDASGAKSAATTEAPPSREDELTMVLLDYAANLESELEQLKTQQTELSAIAQRKSQHHAARGEAADTNAAAQRRALDDVRRACVKSEKEAEDLRSALKDLEDKLKAALAERSGLRAEANRASSRAAELESEAEDWEYRCSVERGHVDRLQQEVLAAQRAQTALKAAQTALLRTVASAEKAPRRMSSELQGMARSQSLEGLRVAPDMSAPAAAAAAPELTRSGSGRYKRNPAAGRSTLGRSFSAGGRFARQAGEHNGGDASEDASLSPSSPSSPSSVPLAGRESVMAEQLRRAARERHALAAENRQLHGELRELRAAVMKEAAAKAVPPSPSPPPLPPAEQPEEAHADLAMIPAWQPKERASRGFSGFFCM